MKKKIILVSVFACFVFISCKKEEVKDLKDVETKATSFSGEDWLKQRVGNQVQIQPVQQSTQSGQSISAVPQKTPAGINPPHGQPNHRCDIPVGAPLNSTPTPKVQSNPQPVTKPVQVSQPAQLTSQPTQQKATSVTNATVVTAPGMNPPHGQEGHRCDIAVGAPLPKS